jgi:hypothetical protein
MFAWRDAFSVSTRGRPSCGPNCWSSRERARISACTSSCSASNSGSNSSSISTTQLTLLIWHAIHMFSNPYIAASGFRRSSGLAPLGCLAYFCRAKRLRAHPARGAGCSWPWLDASPASAGGRK